VSAQNKRVLTITTQIRCSYLDLTEGEKKEFLIKKTGQDSQKIKQQRQRQQQQQFPSPASISSESTIKDDLVFINLMPHKRPEILISQTSSFIDESASSLQSRLFYIKMVNKSLYRPKEALITVNSFSVIWLHLQKKKRHEAVGANGDQEYKRTLDYLIRLATDLKSQTIMLLRELVLEFMEAQRAKDYRTALGIFDRLNSPTISLQSSDIISKSDLKSYYITGSLTALRELHEHTEEESPVTKFVLHSLMQIQRCLFIPCYSSDILEEILEVLNEMEGLINDTNDAMLRRNYDRLVNFFEQDVNNKILAANSTPGKVTSYPASWLYLIFHKFYQIVPSEIYTLNSTDSPTHRVFYSFFYMISRVLDNIFPETRYLTSYRFIGPTSIYPYTRDDLFSGLSTEHTAFANYSTRLLVFFSRRYDLFFKYMKINNPFPDSLAENRFKSRKLKIQEVFVTRFRDTILKPHHYPHAKETRSNGTTPPGSSPLSVESFSGNFNSAYPLHFDLGRSLSLELGNKQVDNSMTSLLNLFDVDESGLLVIDYDPLKAEIVKDLGLTVFDSGDIRNYFEDRTALMKEFIRED
jgi:hypothetical protein